MDVNANIFIYSLFWDTVKMLKSITVDNLIKQLKTVKKQVGGNAIVFADVPYKDGVGWDPTPILNAHCDSNNGHLALKLQK